MSEQKLCVECRHYREPKVVPFLGLVPRDHSCAHPSRRSVVTGHIVVADCETRRSLGAACGPHGLWWEPKA